jgi:hypothetical protein
MTKIPVFRPKHFGKAISFDRHFVRQLKQTAIDCLIS